MDFDFLVGGIEDGCIALLKHLHGRREDNPSGYLNDVASYGGELDEKQLRTAVDQLSGMFPLELVSYGDGVDKPMPPTSAAFGEPRIWQHHCTFSVIACSDNARGETEQRRGAVGDVGVYKMIADIWTALAGVRFAWRPNSGEPQIVVLKPNRRPEDDDVLLNLEPLRPSGVEYLARLKGLTAYAVHFDTYFKWTEPDRRQADTSVEELVFDVAILNSASQPGELPGVS